MPAEAKGVKMNNIEIYYCSVCGLCTKAIEFLRSSNLTFTAYAIEYDKETDEFVDSQNTRDMYKKCGKKVEFVPQIFINGHHIEGWKKLEPMIESGEINKILEN